VNEHVAGGIDRPIRLFIRLPASFRSLVDERKKFASRAWGVAGVDWHVGFASPSGMRDR